MAYPLAGHVTTRVQASDGCSWPAGHPWSIHRSPLLRRQHYLHSRNLQEASALRRQLALALLRQRAAAGAPQDTAQRQRELGDLMQPLPSPRPLIVQQLRRALAAGWADQVCLSPAPSKSHSGHAGNRMACTHRPTAQIMLVKAWMPAWRSSVHSCPQQQSRQSRCDDACGQQHCSRFVAALRCCDTRVFESIRPGVPAALLRNQRRQRFSCAGRPASALQ